MDGSQRPIDLLLDGGRRYWFSAFVLLLVLFAAMTAAILRVDPLFEGRALIVIGPRDIDANEAQRQGQETAALVTTMAGIAESEEVLKTAVERIGLGAFVLPDDPGRLPIVLRARQLLYPGAHVPAVSPDPLETIVRQLANRIRVRAQPLSNLLQLTFRDEDPAFAAHFTNVLAEAFVDRQRELFGRSGAAEFFARQTQSLDEELQARFAEYQAFARQTGLHAVDEQRQLLLRQVFETSANITKTRISILDKQGQRQAITAQLRSMVPVARSPYVSSLVTAFGDGGEPRTGPQAQRAVPEERMQDPPLLLVRAYQENMTSLFRINAELIGLERVEQEQVAELRRLQDDLLQLVNGEAQFELHRHAIQAALRNKETVETRMIQERVLEEARNAKISPVRLFQRAVPDPGPVFPRYGVLLPMAAAASLGLTLALVLLRQAMFARRTGRRALSARAMRDQEVSIAAYRRFDDAVPVPAGREARSGQGEAERRARPGQVA